MHERVFLASGFCFAVLMWLWLLLQGYCSVVGTGSREWSEVSGCLWGLCAVCFMPMSACMCAVGLDLLDAMTCCMLCVYESCVLWVCVRCLGLAATAVGVFGDQVKWSVVLCLQLWGACRCRAAAVADAPQSPKQQRLFAGCAWSCAATGPAALVGAGSLVI